METYLSTELHEYASMEPIFKVTDSFIPVFDQNGATSMAITMLHLNPEVKQKLYSASFSFLKY
jgi:hypothetical protein